MVPHQIPFWDDTFFSCLTGEFQSNLPQESDEKKGKPFGTKHKCVGEQHLAFTFNNNSSSVYVAGNIGNPALPVMPRQYRKKLLG